MAGAVNSADTGIIMQNLSDDIFEGRIEELARAAAGRGCFMFSDFLNPAQQSYVLSVKKNLPAEVSFFGGYETAERVIARFGCEEEAGYAVQYPIILLHISPLNMKFSDKLTHRDFLGAVLNLGIDRRLTGDILTDGKEGWLFAREHIAGFIEESLTRVKHTSVFVSRADKLPEGLVPEPAAVSLIVPSLRLDAVISKSFGLSRKEVQNLLNSEKIFVNSRIQEKASYILKENDLVSVRGSGRLKYIETAGITKKENIKITVLKY